MKKQSILTRRRTLGVAVAVVAAGVVAAGTTIASAGETKPTGQTSTAKPTMARPVNAKSGNAMFDLLAKAKPDECFDGIGKPYPAGPPCASGKAKVNQAYVWGLTQAGTNVWFGTGANVHCLVSGATLQLVKPSVNDNWTCEFGESQVAKDDSSIPAYIGDMRPPEVWTYNTNTGESTNRSADIRAKSAEDADRLDHTVGLRAAGNFDGVALFGGPAIGNTVNMFAFDTTTMAYLGSKNFTEYGNIRTFLTADDGLYLGVGIGRNGTAGGGVLRWTGSAASPFDFVNVGALPVQAADLTVNDGRVVATSWPLAQVDNPEQLAGVWISPKLADGAPGLNPEDAKGWKQVWNVGLYEKDKVIAGTYGGGGIAAMDGWVYWGTMHVPMKAGQVLASKYPPADDAASRAQLVNSQRATSIWRGKDLGEPTQKIELLYGEKTLPVYDPEKATFTQTETGYTPLYGKSGFGNPFNNYTWRMITVDNKLYVGTMDWSYLLKDLIASGTDKKLSTKSKKEMSDPAAWSQGGSKPNGFGGDLFVFPSVGEPAKALDTKGLGNYLNYGIRNMIPNGNGLFIGMANPMNLRTDENDNRPEGGWELRSFTGKP